MRVSIITKYFNTNAHENIQMVYTDYWWDRNVIDYFPWRLRIWFRMEFISSSNLILTTPRLQRGRVVLFNLFSIFQFSRKMRLDVLHGAIVASLSRLRRIRGKLQSIARVATEFIERSMWCTSLKTIDFPPANNCKFYCYKFSNVATFFTTKILN